MITENECIKLSVVVSSYIAVAYNVIETWIMNYCNYIIGQIYIKLYLHIFRNCILGGKLSMFNVLNLIFNILPSCTEYQHFLDHACYCA